MLLSYGTMQLSSVCPHCKQDVTREANSLCPVCRCCDWDVLCSTAIAWLRHVSLQDQDLLSSVSTACLYKHVPLRDQVNFSIATTVASAYCCQCLPLCVTSGQHIDLEEFSPFSIVEDVTVWGSVG